MAESDAEKAVDLARKATRKAVQQEGMAESRARAKRDADLTADIEEIDEASLRERGQLAVLEAAEEDLSRRPFTITKFGRHEDGYFHARVTPAHGAPVYVHRKFGSWMAPGTDAKGKPVQKDVMPRVAAALQEKARAIEKAERLEVERKAAEQEVAAQEAAEQESVA